jgi:hypothetical protein
MVWREAMAVTTPLPGSLISRVQTQCYALEFGDNYAIHPHVGSSVLAICLTQSRQD